MRKGWFKNTPPCKECPFIRGCVKGWLGPDTPEEVMEKVHSEAGYVCHMSIAGKPQLPDGTIDVQKYGHQCIGALLHATISCKSYRDPVMNQHQRAVAERFLESLRDDVLDALEFRVYHGAKLNATLQSAWERRLAMKKK